MPVQFCRISIWEVLIRSVYKKLVAIADSVVRGAVGRITVIKNIVTVCLGFGLVTLYGLAEPAIPVLGHVVASSVSVDEMKVPSGTTLLGKTLVTTLKSPATIGDYKDYLTFVSQWAIFSLST